MTATVGGLTALGDTAARQLANATKTVPQLATITPRWLTHLLQWLPVEAGIYRLNQVKNPEAVKAACTAREDESILPRTFVPYEEQPREYFLNAVSTVLDVHTRLVAGLYLSLDPPSAAGTALAVAHAAGTALLRVWFAVRGTEYWFLGADLDADLANASVADALLAHVALAAPAGQP